MNLRPITVNVRVLDIRIKKEEVLFDKIGNAL